MELPENNDCLFEQDLEELGHGFANMMRSGCRRDATNSISDALVFLLKDSSRIRYSTEDAVLAHVRMTDMVFRILLYPLSETECFWTSSLNTIKALLDEMGCMLNRISGDGSTDNPLAKAWYSDGNDSASLIQHFFLYSATLASLADDRVRWADALELIAASTRADVDYLLQRDDALELWQLQSPSTEGRTVAGSEMWAEPLLVIAKEAQCLQMSYRRDVVRELSQMLERIASYDSSECPPAGAIISQLKCSFEQAKRGLVPQAADHE